MPYTYTRYLRRNDKTKNTYTSFNRNLPERKHFVNYGALEYKISPQSSPHNKKVNK